MSSPSLAQRQRSSAGRDLWIGYGFAATGAIAFAIELMPRITRSQSMDALSSMATVAGYKGVLLAANQLPRMFPMLMTAAGTVSPARVFVVGAGVACLEAREDVVGARRRLEGDDGVLGGAPHGRRDARDAVLEVAGGRPVDAEGGGGCGQGPSERGREGGEGGGGGGGGLGGVHGLRIDSPAVDADRLPRDVPRRIGREERDERRDLGRIGVTAHGDPLQDRLFLFVGEAGGHVRQDESRGHRGHRDGARRDLEGGGAGETEQSPAPLPI